MRLRTSASSPVPQGRHPAFRTGSLALRHGSCLLPLELPFSSSRGRPCFQDLPSFGAYRAFAVTAGRPAASHRIAHSATIRIPFPVPVATPERCSGLVCSSRTAGSRIPTLAHSSNYRSMFARETDCVCPKVRNRGHGGHYSARGWLLRSHRFFHRVATRNRSPPDFLVECARRNDPPRGSR